MTEQKQCPQCHSTNVANILYGMPTSKAMKEAAMGKIVLGGCVIGINNPQFHCNDCEYRWSEAQSKSL